MISDEDMDLESLPELPVTNSLSLPTTGSSQQEQAGTARSKIDDNNLGGQGNPNVRSPSITGDFIKLAREGKLRRISALQKRYLKLLGEQACLRRKLDACFNRGSQLELADQVLRQGGNVEVKFSEHLDILQKREASVNSDIQCVRADLMEIDPPSLDCEPVGPTPPRMEVPRFLTEMLTPQTNLAAFLRDLVTAKYRSLGTGIICAKLDTEPVLMRSGEPPVGLPERWTEVHGVHTFVEAYNHPKCQNLVQKMISDAKSRFGVLP